MDTTITAGDFFAAKLTYEMDPADLAAARAAGDAPVVIDTRSAASWAQGRIPGAIHLPGPELAGLAALTLPDLDADIVVYCWGPGCNGSTRAALTLVSLGYRRVRELIGGFEYWAREGLAIETGDGRTRRPVDPLTAPVPSVPPAPAPAPALGKKQSPGFAESGRPAPGVVTRELFFLPTGGCGEIARQIIFVPQIGLLGRLAPAF